MKIFNHYYPCGDVIFLFYFNTKPFYNHHYGDIFNHHTEILKYFVTKSHDFIICLLKTYLFRYYFTFDSMLILLLTILEYYQVEYITDCNTYYPL